MTKMKTGYLLAIFIVFITLQSCNDGNQVKAKIARAVPKRYVNADDLGFEFHQDTIYFQKKPFSGIQYALYPNGDTSLIKPYFAGLEEGLIKQWYPNKQLSEERFYLAGRKEGTHKGWWPKGNLKFVYQFDNDEFNGTVKEWYESGNLFKTFHFVKGHEEGSQQMWWINGKTRANYSIKNGRRYGLLGTKNCINVADSVFINP